jgi:hypothetical protein
MITKLSGTFSVISVNKPTKRKGFSLLKEHDVFKIEMPMEAHESGRHRYAVWMNVIINGNSYGYSLNDISTIFSEILTVQQIN